jgi:hypothetical protein
MKYADSGVLSNPTTATSSTDWLVSQRTASLTDCLSMAWTAATETK